MLNRLPRRLRRQQRLGHGLEVVRDLGDQDDVRPARQPGAERQPAGVVAHDLDDDDPVVAVGRGVQPVDRLGRRWSSAVSKPNVTSVIATSLSIVFGSVTMFSPRF